VQQIPTQLQLEVLGRLKREQITERDAEGRFNYRKADYRNYADGDTRSVLDKGDIDTAGRGYRGSGSMYINNNDEQTSLINDEVRVYKGGSWKDRQYWLSPGERRYLLQTEARDDLGFRCAMTRVGQPAGL